jgi:drug/metabolite transporter (DMT)-like permease
MNGLGNFCAAVGQVHTGGTSQALLQLVGIPFVIGLAWIFLQQRPSLIASLAALAIVGGTALSAVPHATKDAGSLWYSVVLFFTAQVFFSGEKVYEEATFGK